jgi:hypothetical protein
MLLPLCTAKLSGQLSGKPLVGRADRARSSRAREQHPAHTAATAAQGGFACPQTAGRTLPSPSHRQDSYQRSQIKTEAELSIKVCSTFGAPRGSAPRAALAAVIGFLGCQRAAGPPRSKGHALRRCPRQTALFAARLPCTYKEGNNTRSALAARRGCPAAVGAAGWGCPAAASAACPTCVCCQCMP